MSLQLLRSMLRRDNFLGTTARTFRTTAFRHEIFRVKSEEDFDEKVKKSDKPVVVDFFANWCSPCKKLTPRLETIIDEKAGAIKLAKVNIDEFYDLALDYDVGAVPVLLVMKNGKVLNRLVGLQDTEEIRAWIERSVDEKKGTK